jgi:hypothetical protein
VRSQRGGGPARVRRGSGKSFWFALRCRRRERLSTRVGLGADPLREQPGRFDRLHGRGRRARRSVVHWWVREPLRDPGGTSPRATVLGAAGVIARIIWFDKRGMGVSDRDAGSPTGGAFVMGGGFGGGASCGGFASGENGSNDIVIGGAAGGGADTGPAAPEVSGTASIAPVARPATVPGAAAAATTPALTRTATPPVGVRKRWLDRVHGRRR